MNGMESKLAPKAFCILADFEKSNFAPVDLTIFPSPLQMSVMPVVAYREGEIRMLGTCFAFTNNGLVLTARHVIDEALQITGWSADTPPVLQGGWHIGAIYTSEHPEKVAKNTVFGGILPARKLHLSPMLDLGVMYLSIPVFQPSNLPIRVPALQLSPGIPVEGETCIAIGYHAMMANNDVPHNISIAQSFSATHGLVKEIHYPLRDRFNLNFPCFQVAARYDPGMSGGPILNESGGVIGVVCSSFGADEEGQHTSYGSLIGPSFGIQIDALVDGREQNLFLYDFVLGGAAVADESLSVSRITRTENSLMIDFGGGRQLETSIGN
jgi:S1-C subfamily serine protease